MDDEQDEIMRILDAIVICRGLIDSHFASINATNKCRVKATGRAYPLERRATEREAQVLEWIQTASMQDPRNCIWSLDALVDIQETITETVGSIANESRSIREKFAKDVSKAYVRNCLLSVLHRDTIHNLIKTEETELTFGISKLHELAESLVRNAGDVIDRYRTDIGEALIAISAPHKENITLLAYLRLTSRVPWRWDREFPGALTWHHLVVMFMIIADVVCTIFRTNPPDQALMKTQVLLGIPMGVFKTFLNTPQKWDALRNLDTGAIPLNFQMPNRPPADLTDERRVEILQQIKPCSEFKGVCYRPLPLLYDFSFNALPGETLAEKQELYERNRPPLTTKPISF